MSLSGSGWQVFAPEPAVAEWVAAARPAALAALRTSPRRHGGTWAPGVDALDNDSLGRVGLGPGLNGPALARRVSTAFASTGPIVTDPVFAGPISVDPKLSDPGLTGPSLSDPGLTDAIMTGPPLTGAAMATAQAIFGPLPLHKAQISGVYLGYPRQDPDESDANHAFRRNRDAAHLDGLLPVGPDRRRHLIEPHAWILGLPLTHASSEAAPLVVYEGSPRLIYDALAPVLHAHPPETWGQLDLTEPYHAARRAVFQTCPRRLVPLQPGQAVLVHRLAIHGVAPWGNAATSDPAGRLIAYFRPQVPQIAQWLDFP